MSADKTNISSFSEETEEEIEEFSEIESSQDITIIEHTPKYRLDINPKDYLYTNN